MLNRPRIRQLSLGELLDESFRLYRSNFLTFVAIAALVLVPYSLISFAVQYPFQAQIAELQNQANSANFGGQSPFELIGEMIPWYVITIAVSLFYTVVFQPIMEGALAHSIAQRYLGREIGLGGSFGMALRHAPALIGARLIPVLIGTLFSGVLIGGSVLLATLIIGGGSINDLDTSSLGILVLLSFLGFAVFGVVTLIGLALMIRIMFTSQAVIVENAGAWQSLVRSWRLTQGSFWRILGYVLLMVLLIYVLAVLPVSVVSFIGGIIGLDQRILFVINACAGAVLGVITTPFSMIAYTLLYFDLRVRKEGFDLEYQANALLPNNMGMSAFESR
ncbi:MAG: glycerophosphoryl diester phosphodiesterase membrane domain-containing protein [Chloroflexi bacterium]|nr:glycerophosphoryl diester phosphodiesterase membrane domain-containing protein [Chloroflexota bacterium]